MGLFPAFDSFPRRQEQVAWAISLPSSSTVQKRLGYKGTVLWSEILPIPITGHPPSVSRLAGVSASLEHWRPAWGQSGGCHLTTPLPAALYSEVEESTCRLQAQAPSGLKASWATDCCDPGLL